VGRADLNMELSKDRAKNVRAYIEKYVPQSKGSYTRPWVKVRVILLCNRYGLCCILRVTGEY